MIGTGILKGMAVTARNFVGSYFDKERLITVQYPEERSPLPENYRNFPILIYDNDPEAGLRCVACKICEKECPPQCIYIIKSDDKKPDYMGKPQFYPAVFRIDIRPGRNAVRNHEAIRRRRHERCFRSWRCHDLLQVRSQIPSLSRARLGFDLLGAIAVRRSHLYALRPSDGTDSTGPDRAWRLHV